MKDTYRNFAELQSREKEGIDYRIEIRKTHALWTILAPHGGRIEPGTSELARAIAGSECSIYLFEGLKRFRNRDLHITSTHFDEPGAIEVVASSARTVAIHGVRGGSRVVFIGGRDTDNAQAIMEELSNSGFDVQGSPFPELKGIDPRNICNRNSSGCGVQIELRAGLRDSMFIGPGRLPTANPTNLFEAFVNAVRSAILPSSRSRT